MTKVRRYIAGAPLTFTWLAVLLATTVIQHRVSPQRLQYLLAARSTNLRHLAADPLHVLFTSLLWIDGRHWWPYLLLFTVFLAPAENWLGTLRFVAVGFISHVVATYLSEGYLYWRIEEGLASPRLIDARDIGVSYFLVGIAGVLTYRIPRGWRLAYVAAAAAVAVIALLVWPGFTSVGHLCALLIGLASYPLAQTENRSPVAA